MPGIMSTDPPTREGYRRSVSMSESGTFSPVLQSPTTLSPAQSNTDLFVAPVVDNELGLQINKIHLQAKKSVIMLKHGAIKCEGEEDRKKNNLKIFEMGQLDRRKMLNHIGKGPVLSSSSNNNSQCSSSSSSTNGNNNNYNNNYHNNGKPGSFGMKSERGGRLGGFKLRPAKSSPCLLPPISEDAEQFREEDEESSTDSNSDDSNNNSNKNNNTSSSSISSPLAVPNGSSSSSSSRSRHRRTNSDPFHFSPSLDVIPESPCVSIAPKF